METLEEIRVELFNSNRHIAFSDVNQLYLKTVDELIKTSNFKDTVEKTVYHSQVAGITTFFKRLCEKLDEYKENEING